VIGLVATATMLLTSIAPFGIEDLRWLAGCWEQRRGSRVVEEHWTKVGGNSILGMNRTVSAGRTVAWEYMRIEERGGRLFFIALPSGQSEAEFAQTGLDERSVTFENPDHDFPQRISYRLLPDGSIIGRAEGGSGESLRVVEFPMVRVSCE
jgi:hypothetical protein